MFAFLQKYRTKLILMFAIGYPTILGYLWYLLHIGPFVKSITGTYPKDPEAEFLIFFLPAIVALFLLPIRPLPFRVTVVTALAVTYLTFMAWPVMAIRHATYCSLYTCLPY
ncbi:MAG: hypothetical protein EPN97_10560 [Alphaproteobacteria bacterium]|nr:MAG: hypothetical protein EPN97_10560 [Alphaproteobacteria bacterium]